jgi:hypothetical protein
VGTEVGKPVPREEAFDADDEIVAIGRNRLEKRPRCRLPLPVPNELAVLVQDTEGHGPGVQVDATLKLVWLDVEAPEVASSSSGG